MLDPVGLLIDTLNKERKEFHLLFVPVKAENKFNRDDGISLFRASGVQIVKYGYYEIKESSLGPIMILVCEDKMSGRHVESRILFKVPAIKWHVGQSSSSGGRKFAFESAFDFIYKMPKVDAGLSEQDMKRLYDNYLDIKLPETAKNIKAPDVWADSGRFSFGLLEALARKDGEHKPFEPGDFVPTDEFGWFERDFSR